MYASVKDENDPFIKLTQRFGDGRTDNSLLTAALAIYDKLRSLPRYRDVIREEYLKRKTSDEAGELAYADRMASILGDAVEYMLRRKSELEDEEGLIDLLESNPD